MTDDFLTVDEVATTQKVNPQTVRNWIDRGALPAYRIGRRVRISRADFDEFVARGSTSVTAVPASNIWDGQISEPQVP
jgi:excisionase family DNA binding protein